MGNAATQEVQHEEGVGVGDTHSLPNNVTNDAVAPLPSTTKPEESFPEFVMNIDRLKKMNIFVLDITMRKSCSGNFRGNTGVDKKRIWNTIKDTGFDNFVVASFRESHSLEDEIAAHVNLTKSRSQKQFHYSMTELYSVVEAGIPSFATPAGITKMAKYGISNVVLDFCIFDPFIDWRKFSTQDFMDLVVLRLEQIRASSRNGRIFLCIRDAFDTFRSSKNRNKILSFIAYAAVTLVPRYNIFGIMVEDSTGTLLPWEIAGIIATFRATMDSNGWINGHLLVQVGKGFGMAEMNVMAALSEGATGIWCGICEEGGIAGHACSTSILTNLFRMGNPFVSSRFHIGRLCQAAAKATKIITGGPVAMRQEIYGPRCVSIMQDKRLLSDVADDTRKTLIFDDEADYRNDPLLSMVPEESDLSEQMELTFGEREYDIMVLSNMRRLLLLDTKHKRKCDYYSSIGLFTLYERAGGDEYLDEMAEIIIHDESYAEFDNHPLLLQLYAYFRNFGDSKFSTTRAGGETGDMNDDFDDASSSDGEVDFSFQNFSNPMLGLTHEAFEDEQVSYRAFFDAFASNFIPHMATREFKDLVLLLDASKSDSITWNQIKLRARWALAEFPLERDCWTLEEFIHTIMTAFLLPELNRRKRCHLFADALVQAGKRPTGQQVQGHNQDEGMNMGSLYGEDSPRHELDEFGDGGIRQLSQGFDDDNSGETEGSVSHTDSTNEMRRLSWNDSSTPVNGDLSSPLFKSPHERGSSSQARRSSIGADSHDDTDAATLKKKMDAFSMTTRSGENVLNRRRSSVIAAQAAQAAAAAAAASIAL